MRMCSTRHCVLALVVLVSLQWMGADCRVLTSKVSNRELSAKEISKNENWLNMLKGVLAESPRKINAPEKPLSAVAVAAKASKSAVTLQKYKKLSRDGSCENDSFACSNGWCIPSSWKCDGDRDCEDGSDEVDCRECNFGRFHCDNNRCIPQGWQCDGDNDCGDGSDERNCPCDHDEFQCGNNRCIPQGWQCDGDNDCGDDSDERNCVCSNFTCDNGRCYQSWRQCDGYDDCGDNSDERNCRRLFSASERRGRSLKSLIKSKAFEKSKRANEKNPKKMNARDKEEYRKGNIGQFSKKALALIHAKTKEYRKGNTGQFSKKALALIHAKTNFSACDEDEFQCYDDRCIPQGWQCDGDNDCFSGEDERNCDCDGEEFMCTIEGTDFCVPDSWSCDDEDDCDGGYDESDCDKRKGSARKSITASKVSESSNTKTLGKSKKGFASVRKLKSRRNEFEDARLPGGK